MNTYEEKDGRAPILPRDFVEWQPENELSFSPTKCMEVISVEPRPDGLQERILLNGFKLRPELSTPPRPLVISAASVIRVWGPK